MLNQRAAGAAINLYFPDKPDEDDQEVDNTWYSYIIQLRLCPAPAGKETECA